MKSIRRPIRKSITELRRPDLRGNFTCHSCRQVFQHQASLNRHRLDNHGDESKCTLCNKFVEARTRVSEHMNKEHNIQTVYTCGCCNWSFQSKKLMNDHTAVLRKTGKVGDIPAIAITIHEPGSLIQSNQTSRRSLSPSESSSSSRSMSFSPIQKDVEMMVKEEPPESAEPSDMIHLETASPFQEVLDKLCALYENAPYIETFEYALSFIFESIAFTREQVEEPIVIMEIAETALKLTGTGGMFVKKRV